MSNIKVVKRQHVKVVSTHGSIVTKSDVKQNYPFPTNHYPFHTKFVTITTFTTHEKWDYTNLKQIERFNKREITLSCNISTFLRCRISVLFVRFAYVH